MTDYYPLNLEKIHPTWKACVQEALKQVDSEYLKQLTRSNQWLPGPDKIFNAFTLPLDQVNYVLLGESPYPRKASANGYAFWDEAVTDLWSPSGLSKPINRATSMRNIIKMLLITEGVSNPTQEIIAQLDKKKFIQSNPELFNNLINHGFLLLNASLVLQETPVQKDARAWQPFIKYVLEFLIQKRPQIHLILFGKIANQIDALVDHAEIKRLYAEHPYNLSFITNPEVLSFFKPLKLLRTIANQR